MAGTDPTNPASVFVLSRLGDASSGNIAIRWLTATGRVYGVRGAASVSATGIWVLIPAASNIVGTGGAFVHTADVERAERFYRVTVDRAP